MPRSYRIIAIVVVATTLVRDAKSKTVAGIARAESGAGVSRPKDFRATNRSRCATAMAVAAKAPSWIASRSTQKPKEKTSSCCSKAGTRLQTWLTALCPMTNWDLRGYSRVAGAGKEYGMKRNNEFFNLFCPSFIRLLGITPKGSAASNLTDRD